MVLLISGPLQLFLALNTQFFLKIEVKNQAHVKNSTKTVERSNFFHYSMLEEFFLIDNECICCLHTQF